MPAPRVFVSHSHQDDDFTRKLVNDLSAAGADVWVDVAELHEGNFIEHINRALSWAEWLTLVLTPNAIGSSFVRDEVNAALNLKHQRLMHGVIPVLAQQCDLREIPPLWGVLQRYDATKDYESALHGILRAIGLRITGTSEPSPKPTQQLPIRDSAEDWISELVREAGRLGIRPGDPSNYSTPPGPQGANYQRFWIALATELRKQHLRYTPSTIDFASYCEFGAGYPGCLYVAAFTREGARISFDISRHDGKHLYDALCQERSRIEASFGGPLVWERKDSHIMSRISSIFHEPARVTDDVTKLKAVHTWMSDSLLHLQEALDPCLERVGRFR